MVRTTIWGAIRWLFLRKYFASLFYLPAESDIDLNRIPSINEPLDEKLFIKENDRWNFFIANNTKFIGETIKPNPLAKLEDGLIDIVALKASTSGRSLLAKELITYIDNGDEFISKDGKIREGIHCYKTKCFRLIPKINLEDPDDSTAVYNFGQKFSIDGERYPIKPIQCKVLNKILNFYCGKE